jgi:hypothetical protein
MEAHVIQVVQALYVCAAQVILVNFAILLHNLQTHVIQIRKFFYFIIIYFSFLK